MNQWIEQLTKQRLKLKHLASSLLILVLLAAPISASAQPAEGRHILVLHSYHQGYQWTDSVHEGFKNVLSTQPEDIIHIEYMDTIANQSPEYLNQLALFLAEKHGPDSLDLIAVTDDPALRFLQAHPELFPEVPVVFCGINNLKREELVGQRPMTGVNESISIQETLDLAIGLMPAAKTIGVVSGVRTTEVKNLELFRGKIGSTYNGITVKYMAGLPQDELSEQLSSFTEQDIIIYLGYLAQPSGKVLTVEESIKWIIGSVKAPVFSYWDFLIPYGIIGGKVVHGQSQGEAMGRLANRILAGEPADAIPVELESPNRFILNDQAVLTHGLDRNRLDLFSKKRTLLS